MNLYTWTRPMNTTMIHRSFIPHLLVLFFTFFVHVVVVAEERSTKNNEQGTEIFRPKAGEFPPLEKAHSYRGELTFVEEVHIEDDVLQAVEFGA